MKITPIYDTAAYSEADWKELASAKGDPTAVLEDLEELWAMAGQRGTNVNISCATNVNEEGERVDQLQLTIVGHCVLREERYLICANGWLFSFDSMCEILVQAIREAVKER